MEKIKLYLKEHPDMRQVILFALFALLALAAQLISRILLDLLFAGLDKSVNIWPFGEQALGSFLAFLISNIIAKILSYITNRKTTFKASNNVVKSAVLYAVMVVVLIIVETIIGTPIQNGLYTAFGGTASGAAVTTASVSNAALYQLCGTLSQMIYGIADFVVVFFMDKYVLMTNK